MNKTIKILTTIVVAILLVGCLGMLVACGENADTPTPDTNGIEETYAYKFTVVDASGNAVSGIKVQLCTSDSCLIPKTTDDNGVAIFDNDTIVSGTVYDIHILNAPAGYTFDNEAYKTDVNTKDYTLTLVAGN